MDEWSSAAFAAAFHEYLLFPAESAEISGDLRARLGFWKFGPVRNSERKVFIAAVWVKKFQVASTAVGDIRHVPGSRKEPASDEVLDNRGSGSR